MIMGRILSVKSVENSNQWPLKDKDFKCELPALAG